MTRTVPVIPDAVGLDTLRAIHHGAACTLDESCRLAVDAAARVLDAIARRGDPVYGVDTGFGKLASVRICQIVFATIQRKLALSHAGRLARSRICHGIRGTS